MELPRSRPFGTEGKKSTQDFLSLYTHSTVQDPRPPSQGGFLKTHYFLQEGEIYTKEESTVEISSTVEKPLPPSPSVEHILPGGIGTCCISHISHFSQKVQKPEGTISAVPQTSSTEKNDEKSNCSSYTGSGFTLWEESAVKKGKTGEENAGERPIAREATVNVGQWAPQSSNSHRNSFSSLSFSHPPGLKSQSFNEMIKSAKGCTHDEDLDDEDEFILNKENSTTTHKGELGVKVDRKSTDQKPNTPRSKHSATEQRRRCKINDRFQMLRELIPHSDQKRDKASFLLQVIEYIQVLQEKVHKYEGPYAGWNQEPAPWRNNHKVAESFFDQSRALITAAKLDDKKVDMSTATTFKTIDHQPGITNKAMAFPMPLPLQPRLASDAAENTTSQQPQTPLSYTRSCTGDIAVSSNKLKEEELTAEGGTMNISTVYSRGLLNTLTQALLGSGVDLSQASVSVQIDIGKRATGSGTPIAPPLIEGNGGEDSNQAQKKQKKLKS